MGLPLPGQPAWVGLVGVLGVFGVVALIYALRDAGERARQIAAATGAAFVAYVLLDAMGGVVSIGGILSSGFGGEYDETEWAGYVALAAVGVAVGVGAVLAAHRRVAEAAEDLADDKLVEPDPGADVIGEEDEPDAYDDYTARRQRVVAAAPWTDLAAVVIALALPTLAFGSWSYGDFLGGGDGVTAWAVLYHVISGAMLAAPLLVVLRLDRPDPRVVVAGAVLLAARVMVVAWGPEALGNRYWTSLAFGLAAGLLVTAGLPLLAPAIPQERSRLVAGLLAALALMTASVVTYGRAQAYLVGESVDDFGGFEDSD